LIQLGINIDHSLTVPKSSNSIYLGILDKGNDLYLGLNDMKITKSLNKEFFLSKIDYINSFDYVVIDNNLRKTAITYLLKNITKPIIMDAVSAKKVIKLKHLLRYITVLKLNTIELRELSFKDSIDSQMEDLYHKGLKNVLVTDGKYKIRLKNETTYEMMPKNIEKIVNVSGAGDAFLSGFVHGYVNNVNDTTKLRYASICAYHTLKCNEATSKSINKEVLK